MTRKICVVTGTRAEFGLLRALMHDIAQTPGLTLQVVATGMHLSPEFGETYQEIEQAGFAIDCRVDMQLHGDSACDITKSVGVGTLGFADALAKLQPDVVLVLGDRFELLSVVTAALIGGIPVAHVHGGESTEGAFDDAIRHAVTKMSHLHFVAAPEYARRVVQLGEAPERVFMVGGLGVDAITRLDLLDRKALEQSLGFSLGAKNLLVTFHPVTLEGDSALQLQALFDALDELQGTELIITLPNADTGGRELAARVKAYAQPRPHVHVYASLGQLRYLSCLQFVDGVVGNSSSGLTEAPSMRVGTVNIGERQKGRLSAASVIHCPAERVAISQAIARLFEPDFRASLATVHNPYGDGGASRRIVDVLLHHPLEGLLKKRFHDLPHTLPALD